MRKKIPSKTEQVFFRKNSGLQGWSWIIYSSSNLILWTGSQEMKCRFGEISNLLVTIFSFMLICLLSPLLAFFSLLQDSKVSLQQARVHTYFKNNDESAGTKNISCNSTLGEFRDFVGDDQVLYNRHIKFILLNKNLSPFITLLNLNLCTVTYPIVLCPGPLLPLSIG